MLSLHHSRSSLRGNSLVRQSDQSRSRVYFGLGIAVGFLASSLWSSLGASTVTPTLLLDGSYQSINDHSNVLVHRTLDTPHAVSTINDNGWKLLHVYVGASSEARAQHAVQASDIPSAFYQSASWFSQVRQDLVVSTLLRGMRNGYFVDLAANDAIRISNTFALERDFDWTGLAIEPNPLYWSGLSYRSCHVVAAVIGNQTGDELRFTFSRKLPQRGGLVGRHFDNKAQTAKIPLPGEEQMRTAISLRDLFEHFETPSVIDYFSLDVEGAETFIMESFPFDRYRFNVLTVERADDRLRDLLEENDYVKLKELKQWGESLWIHSSLQATVDRAALSIETNNYHYRDNFKRQQATGTGR